MAADQPVADAKRQPAYLLDRDLSTDEYEVRNAIFTNGLIMQGLKALVTKHTSGDILLIGHSTSGELSMLAYEDPELSVRLRGRYLGWGSGGPARIELLRTVRGKEVADRAGASPPGARTPLYILERRDPPSYARGYGGFLNPLLQASMSTFDRRALACGGGAPASQFQAAAPEFPSMAPISARRRGSRTKSKSCSKRTGNPWRISVEDVAKDLFVPFHPDGRISPHGLDDSAFRPQPLGSGTAMRASVFIANEYRAKIPTRRSG
jgi:hypothetical protein